jgi:hypothetical protein
MWNVQYTEFDCISRMLFCDLAQFSMKTLATWIQYLRFVWPLLHILGISVAVFLFFEMFLMYSPDYSII